MHNYHMPVRWESAIFKKTGKRGTGFSMEQSVKTF